MRPRTAAGFTLVELVMVMVIVGVLAIFVLPKALDLTAWRLRAFGALLFGNYFNIFVFSQALSYLAITISLFFLSRVSVIFTVINLCLSAYIFFQIYLLHGILQFTREGIIKQLFHLWLVSYAGYLYNKGMLK